VGWVAGKSCITNKTTTSNTKIKNFIVKYWPAEIEIGSKAKSPKELGLS